MSMIQATTAVRQLLVDGEPRTFSHGNSGSITQFSNTNCSLTFHNSFQSPCMQVLQTSSSFKFPIRTLKSHNLCGNSKESNTRNLLRRWPVNASSDQDYRSSRNIAISVFKRYRNVVDRGGIDNLREFINAGVNAYALGCTDEGLQKELMDMKASGLEIGGLQNFGGGTSVTYKILTEEPTVIRWSSTPPVSDETVHQWKGFCAIIANAYYKRGMAWLPVKTLQLEQMAVTGSAEEPSLVASRMRLVFSTLEVVSPQWPRV